MWRSRLRRGLAAAAVAPVAVVGVQMWYLRFQFRLPPDAQGPLTGVCSPPAIKSKASAASQDATRQRNIIFLGDSVVTGVGCSAEASAERGPLMPRKVAEVLAQALGESISWTVIGETGADVGMARTRLLPLFAREVQRTRSAGQRIDAVVVITGLNDIKECFLFANPRRHPWNFEALMTSLLSSICELVQGVPCQLLVVGCPIDAVPRFNALWPLSVAVKGITGLWEDHKRLATEAAQAAQAARSAAAPEAGSAPVVRFLEPPPHMIAQLLDGAAYFASDGMHPNDAGYLVWGELIAQTLLSGLRASTASATPTSAVVAAISG